VCTLGNSRSLNVETTSEESARGPTVKIRLYDPLDPGTVPEEMAGISIPEKQAMIVMTFEEPSISETQRPDVLAEYAEGADDPQRPLGPYEGIGMLPNKNLLVHPRESLVCAAVTIGDQGKVGLHRSSKPSTRPSGAVFAIHQPISSSDIINERL
jgi:hypothetical protein